MTDIMTNRDLINALLELPLDAKVMIAVVKYPEEFALRVNLEEKTASWLNSTDVECHPLEFDEVTLQDGMIHIAVELEDYDRLRHEAGG